LSTLDRAGAARYPKPATGSQAVGRGLDALHPV